MRLKKWNDLKIISFHRIFILRDYCEFVAKKFAQSGRVDHESKEDITYVSNLFDQFFLNILFSKYSW